MTESIKKQIYQEIVDFNTKSITISEGFSFNQKSTIEKIYRLYNSRYLHGDVDVEGDKKYFYNIVRNPCQMTTKALDFDTKHIKILNAAGGDPLVAWYFERDLKFWMKDQNFGKTLNRIFRELPIFGSVVLKIINGKTYFVDLRNFVVEQSADSLGQAGYKIERYNYTPAEFRKIGTEMKFEKVEEVISDNREAKKSYLTIYERYGEVKNEETGDYEFKRVFMADVGADQEQNRITGKQTGKGVLLKETKVDKIPYWEFHLEKILLFDIF